VESHPTILQALQNPKLVKIGFGLSGDLRQIAHRFGIKPASTVDLDHSFKKLGYHQAIGAKSAVALILNQRFLKSKSVTISNWSAKILNERQLLYAANDAYAAIKIYHALQKQEAPEA
jgi:ribonuclease D